MAHLGTRVSALLDGQMSPEETERAWAHVHACHTCRDRVEREGWVKTRLAGLQYGTAAAPDHLKGSLLGADLGVPPGDVYLALHAGSRPRRNAGLIAVGGGAVGAAVMGVLALGAAPADAPTIDRRLPQMSVVTPSPSTTVLPRRDTDLGP
ncbi:MAG: hypothetical protein JWO11_1176 [Nocardioides sp.]|nr:hypothetical protein [Nocardioides sp.]